MTNIIVPDTLTGHPQLQSEAVTFVHYQDSKPTGRNLISFSKCAISFVLNGQKEMYRSLDSLVVEKGEGVIIPHGHSIIAERSFNDSSYNSLVVFFPAHLASAILKKYGAKIVETSAMPVTPHLLKFRLNAFLSEFVHQVLAFFDRQIPLPEVLVNHKLEELLIALLELDPHGLSLLFDRGLAGTNDLRTLVENNLLKGLSLDELAFLANRSLASFKRDFEKAYGTSPGRYLLERKLDAASHALREGKRATELFSEFGYENLSNFNTAFKRKFNQTPKAYQEAFAH